MTRTILVCGGRNFNDHALLSGVLLEQLKEGDFHLIHGGATGADELAGKWGSAYGLPVTAYYADWAQHGKAAGPIRNKQMLDEGKPSLVIAFPGGKGTSNMLWQAKAAGIPTMEIQCAPKTRKSPTTKTTVVPSSPAFVDTPPSD